MAARLGRESVTCGNNPTGNIRPISLPSADTSAGNVRAPAARSRASGSDRRHDRPPDRGSGATSAPAPPCGTAWSAAGCPGRRGPAVSAPKAYPEVKSTRSDGRPAISVLGQLPAVHDAGHHDVGEQQIERRARRTKARASAAFGGQDHLVTEALELDRRHSRGSCGRPRRTGWFRCRQAAALIVLRRRRSALMSAFGK